ncbi:MAG: UbiA family prenyltransferase [Dehalococcoidia bacterium]|nr:MAG: UbiA family prenyltransferase [Dehalococcoidia bacterium]
MNFPLWIGPIILGLDGAAPEWGDIAIFMVTVTGIVAMTEFANTYSDRDEDRIYFPSNPLVTAELEASTAKKTLILQNALIALLLIALLLVTFNYKLTVTIAVGWFIGLSYSMPPFRFKETVAAPVLYALAVALLPIAAWLVVAPINGFIVAFACFFALHSFGYGITYKFRKTFHALSIGLIRTEDDGSIYNLVSVGLGLKVKTAMALEGVTSLGSFALVPVFWHAGIFDAPLSIGLLTLPLGLTALTIFLRIKDPVGNGTKCIVSMTMAWICIILTLFAVALTDSLNWHWGYAILAALAFPIAAVALFRTVHPFEFKNLAAPWEEI